MSSQAKWKFTDITNSKSLNAVLLDKISASAGEGGYAYVVRLLDKSSGQEFDIGTTVTTLNEATLNGAGQKVNVSKACLNHAFIKDCNTD